MFFYNFFKWSFQYSRVLQRLIKFNYKVLIYFLFVSMLSAFPLNYNIVKENGFRIDFIEQSFIESSPNIKIPYCTISGAGMMCEEDFTFKHGEINYYINLNKSFEKFDYPAIIINQYNIIYKDETNELSSDKFSGFGDVLNLNSINYGSEQDSYNIWLEFGTGIEESFSQYVIVFTLLTNLVVHFLIQVIFVIFLIIVLRLFRIGLSRFMSVSESITFVVWMMTMPSVLSLFVAFIEPVFASVIYQFLVGISIMIVMLKYGRKFYK